MSKGSHRNERDAKAIRKLAERAWLTWRNERAPATARNVDAAIKSKRENEHA